MQTLTALATLIGGVAFGMPAMPKALQVPSGLDGRSPRGRRGGSYFRALAFELQAASLSGSAAMYLVSQAGGERNCETTTG